MRVKVVDTRRRSAKTPGGVRRDTPKNEKKKKRFFSIQVTFERVLGARLHGLWASLRHA